MKKILIVDDSKWELEIMANYLSNCGYQIMTASNGWEAMVMIYRNPPDVVITDWLMPKMGGLDICRQLRKNLKTAKIPVILCTSNDRKVDQFWAKKQGVTEYLIKPWAKSELMKTVVKVLALKSNQKPRYFSDRVSPRKVMSSKEKMAISVNGTI